MQGKSKYEKQKERLAMTTQESNELQLTYMSELDTNPKYSLEVNPENKYKMTQADKEFVNHYVQFKNVNTVAEIMKIDQDLANQMFVSYPIQSEIRRINLALYHRQFASRLLTIDELGGYLTSMLTDNFVPLADKMKPTEKLRVVELLIKLNEMKINSFSNPTELMAKDINSQLRNLSLDTIKQLISQNADKNKKTNIINDINKNGVLSIEEKAYLETLSTQELLKLVDDTNKAKGGKQ